MPEKRKLREELAQFLREYGAVLTGLIILQLVVYSYFFTGLIFTNHTFPNSWVLSYPSYRTRGEGRWLADLIVSLQGGSGVQPFQMAVAVVIHAVNGIAFARLVGLERRLEVALSAAFICLYPAFLDNYPFGMDHVTFGVADAFALAGALCLKRLLPSLKSALIVAFLFVLGIASYQPKIAFVGLLCICYLVMRIAGDGIVYPFALKEAAKEIGYVSSILFGAILVYFGSMKLSVTDDAGVRAHLNSVSDMIRQVPESYKQFFRYFTRDADYLPDWVQLLPVLTILLGCVLLLVGAHRRHIVALALTVMLVLLIPVVLRASYLINSNTWENAGRITFVNGYAFLFFLSQGFQVAGLRNFVAGLLGFFLFFFFTAGTKEANCAAIKTVYDLNMINRIAARIKTNVSNLYVKQHALVVVGRSPPFPRPKYARYGNGYENFNKRIHV